MKYPTLGICIAVLLWSVILIWCWKTQPEPVVQQPWSIDATSTLWDITVRDEEELIGDTVSGANDDTLDTQQREIPDPEWEFDPDTFKNEEITELMEYIDQLLSEAEAEVEAQNSVTDEANE